MSQCAVEKEPSTGIGAIFPSVNDAFLNAFYKVAPEYYNAYYRKCHKCENYNHKIKKQRKML